MKPTFFCLSTILILLLSVAIYAEDLGGELDNGLKELEQKAAAREAALAKQKSETAAASKKVDEVREKVWERYRQTKHPRLLINPERLASIRREIADAGSHHQLAYAAIRDRYQDALDKDWPTRQNMQAKFGRRWSAGVIRELALLSLISEDAQEKRRYAEAAARFAPDSGGMWSLAFTGNLGTPVGMAAIALAYDWGYENYTPQERKKLEAVIDSKLRQIGDKDVGEEELAKTSGYNHLGVKVGGELLLRLAVGDEKISPRCEGLAKKLALYFSGVGGELGAHREGLGYTEYPMSFALPAAIAASELGLTAPMEAAQKHAFWKLNMYAQTFMTSFDRKFIQFGADHQSNYNQGFATGVFPLCPPESLPYYQWFYDRHMGKLSKAESALRFDPHMNSSGLALVTYPTGITAKDPTPDLPKGVVDTKHGYGFFRNRWQDQDDIQVAIIAGKLEGGGGWSTYEQLSLRLMAFDTRFFGGPGKEGTYISTGPEAVRNFTTLLVDGALPKPPAKSVDPQSIIQARDGRLVSFEPSANGGYAIVDKAASGPQAGITNAVRHLMVRFDPPQVGSAMLSTLDDITSTQDHTYTWQGNLGPETMITHSAKKDEAADDDAEKKSKIDASDDGIISSQGKESGRSFFLLKGRRGYVKAWVLHPADATITTGDPIQVSTKGNNARIWIAFYVGSGEPITGSINGSGMDTVLKAAGKTVTFDGKRIICP